MGIYNNKLYQQLLHVYLLLITYFSIILDILPRCLHLKDLYINNLPCKIHLGGIVIAA